ncbi:hypothetical protein Tco_0410756 [Tanacetum coccineum]
MTSSIVKRVALNLMRVRVMASSSRFYNTRCFQYDKRPDSDDVCILKCDSKPGSMVHHAVNHAFTPRVSPTENLLWILNYVDGINGVKYGMHKVPCEEYPSEIHVTESEESILHEEYMFAIHPNDEKHREMNMSFLLHAMRQHEMEQSKSEPSEYYFHVMHDFRELPRLAIPASGIVATFTCITMASSIVKRIASNLIRVRAVASSSRFYNARCFQYDKRNSEDVCILKCDSKPGSMVHHAVNTSFDSRVSPNGNLVRLLNLTDGIIGGKFLSKGTPCNVMEDGKALYLLCTMSGHSKEFEASAAHLEFMFAI